MRRYVHVVVVVTVVVVARSCKRSYCYPVVVAASHVSVAMLRRNYKLSTQHPRTAPLSLSLSPLLRTHAITHTIIKGQISMALIICTIIYTYPSRR